MCQMAEIRRLNKLWSNDSLYLKDIVVIPVLEEEAGPPLPPNGAPATSPPSTARRRSSGKRKGEAALPEEPKPTVSDILSRIDATIKSTAHNVRQLERKSTFVRFPSLRDGR